MICNAYFCKKTLNKYLIIVHYKSCLCIFENTIIDMSEQIFINHTSPIPELFYSDKQQQPFTHCKICEKELISTGEPYMIEKAYSQDLNTRKKAMIFELAYCMDCITEIHETLSVESREKMQAYFNTNANMDKRDAELKKYELFEPDIWLHNCVVKNKSIDEVNEFQIYALCIGDELMYHHAPYMVCGEAVDEIMDLLSNKSLDILNDLMADVIDLPPGFSELFKTRTPLIF